MFILLCMLLAVFLPAGSRAQQTASYRIGVIHQGGPYLAVVEGLRDGLRQMGFEEGKQVALMFRDSKGNLKAVEQASRDFEKDRVHLIFAVTYTSDAMVASQAQFIADTALSKKLPTMFSEQSVVVMGGLASYGQNFHEVGRQSAKYVHKIDGRPSSRPANRGRR